MKGKRPKSKKARAFLEDNGSLSSGGDVSYVLPSAYRPNEVSTRRKDGLTSMRNSHAGQSASSLSTNASGTSRVSGVSISTRTPVLPPDDPLARDIERQIEEAAESQSDPPESKQLPLEETAAGGEAPPESSVCLGEPVDIVVREQEKEPHPNRPNRRRLILAAIAVVMVLVAVVTAVVVLTSGGSKASDDIKDPNADSSLPTTSPPTVQPSTLAPVVPTAAPTPLDEALLQDLLAFVSRQNPFSQAALQNATSPQYHAVEWMVQDVMFNVFDLAVDEDRILQRGNLATLYYSTRGDTWFGSGYWLNHSIHECEWVGVGCIDSATAVRFVNDLYLVENALFGPLPPEIASFPELVSLQLDGNQLTGAIPETLYGLSNLVSFSLTRNDFVGPIPTTLGSMVSLYYIDLSQNSLTGQIPSEIGQLANLGHLDFNSNELGGTIPTEVGELRQLAHLDFYGNFLTGPIPSQLGLLTSLQNLTIDFNALTGELPQGLFSLASCQIFVVGNNQLVGPIPTTFGVMTELRVLNLDINNLSGTIPDTLGQLTNLVTMHLENNTLTGEMPAEVCAIALPNSSIAGLYADCAEPNPEVVCTCCARCY